MFIFDFFHSSAGLECSRQMCKQKAGQWLDLDLLDVSAGGGLYGVATELAQAAIIHVILK